MNLSCNDWCRISEIAKNIRLRDNNSELDQAITRLRSIWEQLENNWLSDIETSIDKTPLTILKKAPDSHPLLNDWNLLSGTQWCYDEPTLTRLLASNFFEINPTRQILFWHLFKPKGLLPNIEFNDWNEFILNNPYALNIETEVSKAYLEKADRLGRRADLLFTFNFPDSQNSFSHQILIEAKVNAKRDDGQLKDLFDIFSNKTGHNKLYCFFLAKEEFPNKMQSSKLPEPWRLITWTEVIAALERTLNWILNQNDVCLKPNYIYWFKLMLGTFWHGTLDVKTGRENTYRKLKKLPQFISVINQLQKGYENE